MAYFDTPLFLSPNVKESKVAGRIMGAYWPTVSGGEEESSLESGFWNFHFFPDQEDDNNNTWIAASLGFGRGNSTVQTPNVVTGGTGRYAGYVGSIQSQVINSDPFVIQYDLCPAPAATKENKITQQCRETFSWASSGNITIGNYSFTGSTPLSSDAIVYGGVANSALFPDANVTSSQVEGRLLGQYFLDRITMASASTNFGFFGTDDDGKEHESWVSVNFGFGPLNADLEGAFTRGTPNIVVGGTGDYSGFVGSMRDKAASSDPLVFLWEICPSEGSVESNTDVLTEGCSRVYEWSTPQRSNHSGYQFAGSSLYDEQRIGVFDNPFFGSPDVQSSEVAGRIMGYYVPNGRGAASGLWNFAFFDEGGNSNGSKKNHHEDWIAASLGFDNDDTSSQMPNVITGGSGSFSGLTGTIEQQIVSTYPFVIEWTICPHGAKSDIGDTGPSGTSGSFSSLPMVIFRSSLGFASVQLLVSLLLQNMG